MNLFPKTPEELAVEWIVWLRDVRQVPENTWEQYAKVLSAWLDWSMAHQVDQLEPQVEQLEAFMTRLRRSGRKGKPSTQHMDATVLRTWYQYLVDRDRLAKNPANLLRAPKVPDSGGGKPIDDEIWTEIWGRDLSPVVRAALGLGYFAGLRTFEIQSTPRVKLGSDLIEVTRKGGKIQVIPWRKLSLVIHKRLPHLLPDPLDLAGPLRTVRSGDQEVIFPYKFESMFYHLVKNLPGYWTPHMLRHSMITNLLRPEVNMPPHLVQEYAGHASLDDTMRYVKRTGDELQRYFPEIDGM